MNTWRGWKKKSKKNSEKIPRSKKSGSKHKDSRLKNSRFKIQTTCHFPPATYFFLLLAMDIASILLSAALILLVAMFIARPLIERMGFDERQPMRADTLTAEREAVVAALRELDFDHTTGKIAEEDYAAQRAALVAQGVALLKQLDEISNQSPAQALDDELEAAIRAARAQMATAPSVSRPAALRCPQCNQPHQPDDRFCSKCGATLAASTQTH